MQHHVIIVAGGSGSRMASPRIGTSRMQSDLPKQFMLLNGKPILMHTLQRFYETDPNYLIRLVLPESHLETWEKLRSDFGFIIPHTVLKGGETRFHSVKNGITGIGEGLIAVHDGVRPLVRRETILDCFREAELHGAAIPVVPVNDSIRQVQPGASIALERSSLRQVQTPQCFRATILQNAFLQDYSAFFTDCASVVESSGVSIQLVKGNIENFKITSPADLELAAILLS